MLSNYTHTHTHTKLHYMDLSCFALSLYAHFGITYTYDNIEKIAKTHMNQILFNTECDQKVEIGWTVPIILVR